MLTPELGPQLRESHRRILAKREAVFLRSALDLIRMRPDAMLHAQVSYEFPLIIGADTVILCNRLQRRRAARIVGFLIDVGHWDTDRIPRYWTIVARHSWLRSRTRVLNVRGVRQGRKNTS